MKKLKFLCSAFLVASLLAIPATAQRVSMGRMGQMHQHYNNTDKGKQNPDSSSLAPRDGLSDTRFGAAPRYSRPHGLLQLSIAAQATNEVNRDEAAAG